MEKSILAELATIVSEKTGLHIHPDNIHKSGRRFYYIPEADPGRPLFLHHYRGPFFIDLPQDDWKKLEKGEISPLEYVNTAHWNFGYYWGGGSMITGGYFTPLEFTTGINDKEKIYRIMTILSCRGSFLASGYRPSKEECEKCNVSECPYSAVVEKAAPLYSDVLRLPDNRRDFFKAVYDFVLKEYGYELHGMCCSDMIPKDEIILYPNYGERTFELYIGDEFVKELLYNPYIEGYNWDRTVEIMKLSIGKRFDTQFMLIESPEDFKHALVDFKILDKWDEEDRRRNELAEQKAARDNVNPVEESKPKTFWSWLKKLFSK
jgi:hypothetical protein